MQKEKGRTANSTTSSNTLMTQHHANTGSGRCATKLELVALHLLENGPDGVSALSGLAGLHDLNVRNSVSDLRRQHDIVILDEFFDHQHSGGGVTRFKQYRLAGRDQARKVAELVNLKRQQRGAAPLSREQIDHHLATFPADPGFLPAA